MAKIESGPSVDSRKIKSSLAVIVHGTFETLTVGLSATTPILVSLSAVLGFRKLLLMISEEVKRVSGND